MGYVLDLLEDIKDDLSAIKMFISEYNGYKPTMWTNEKAAVATNELGQLIDAIVNRNTNNREIMLEAIKFNASYIRDIGDNLINNETFILEAYSNNPNILIYLDSIENLKKFKETLENQKNEEINFENSSESTNKKL